MSESVYSLSHTSSFPDACHEFDHSPITLSLKAPAQATTPIHTCNDDCHTGPQFQWKPDHAARYVGALIDLEEEVMAVKQAVEQGTHPDSINRFVHDIISRAAGSAGMLKPRLCPLARVDKHTTVKPAWFDRSCKEAKAALWQALRSGEALHLYRARKQAYRRLVARAKSAWSKHRAAKLLDMLKHNRGDALKMLRVKHARQQSMVPIDKWHQHLQAYFTTTNTTHDAPDVIPEPARTRQAVPAHLQAVPLGRGRLHSVPAPAPVTTHPPAYELPHLDNITSIVQAQLRDLNNDTAPGLDGLPAPFIKHARTVEEGVTTYLLLPLLATWFHSMMRTGIIPAAWKVARISPLFKDTDPTDPNKYRMLAVSSVLYRLYANVLRHVLTAWCITHKVLPAEQFGFIPGRSTMQPMFILRHLVHAQKASADAKHRKLFTAFIDFKQAYDHIPRQQLWEHLRVGIKLPQPLLACLEGLYRDDNYVLIDGPHRTPPVTPDQGVKQGCPISPLLFALYVHDISKEFLGPVDAVRVQGTPVTHFMYADDLTLVSTSPHGLQRLVCQLQGFADRKHLTINVGKSKVMVFNGNSQTAAPCIGYKHENLPVVREFKYLGMHFNPSATPAFAATHMRAGMFLAMRQACNRAREYGVLHDPFALCHLIRAFVLPLGLYGSQVWGTAFLGHGVQLSNPVQTRMLSFIRFAARVRSSVSGLMVLHELGQLPLQLYWFRAACKFWNTAKLSHSDLLMRVIKADVELGRSCQASWSAQFQLAARELMGDEFTLSPDMVLGTKAMEVKWLERRLQPKARNPVSIAALDQWGSRGPHQKIAQAQAGKQARHCLRRPGPRSRVHDAVLVRLVSACNFTRCAQTTSLMRLRSEKPKQSLLVQLCVTLSLLRKHQLCANLAKCAFWLDTVDFLGHIVSAAGIQPDPTKVKAVLDWPAPQDKHQLRSFLGTANYYRRLLHHHAHRVLPLTDLLRDEQPWRWGEAEQRAFADIKAAMASSPVVRPPDFSLPFTVKTDASLFAIGAVLTQQDSSGAEYVVAYESRKLNPAQVNYPAHERELLAVLHALTTWRHYLLGRPFIVETDNSATTHVLTQSNLTGRQMRWTQRLAEFDITFVHKAGKHHTVPDALSRRPDHQLTALSIVDPDPSFFSTFDRHAPEDPAYQAALSQALSPPSPSSPTHLQVIEGRLYTTSTPPRLYIPSSPLRAQLLHEAHDAHTAAHLGRAKTLERLQRHFYWPQMHKTVQEYVRTCDKCQRNKATNQLPPGLLQPLPIPSRNWQQVSMDFIGPLPATPRGHTMIFTIVDKLSKMIHLIPTTTTATAQDTARLFFDHIFKHHGLPEAIVSDRDPKFTSDFWTSLFHLTGTRLLLSSAYHPQTDGQTERANRTVEDMLRPYVNDHKSDWDQHLAAVEFAYNSSEHAGTGFTPFYLNYGQHPTTPSALLLPPPTLVPSQAAEDFVTSMRNNLTAARSALQRSIDTQKLHADQHRRHEEFEVGDLVLLSCANLNLQTAVNSAKLQPRFVGPFKVLAKHSPVSYKLDLPSSMRILPTFHISRLWPYLSSSSFPERAVELQPSPVIIDGEAYFTVEAILGRRWNDAQHAFQYLIKWAGYDDSFNSWEWGPALAQQDAVAALIRDYTARHHAPVDDDPACQVCASRSPRPPMLLCDQCDKGFHITCLSPPLRSVPRGAWLCHQCKQAKAPKKRR
ncbi:hypothetical protein QJQ45_021195 [Haematococcus lacustris]|nr:hypothetical protein QJQ45_021195 [Haematococcus lacustris]